MSTETQNSQNQGESRRRRSRGGQNRNNNNRNSTRRNNEGRQSNGSSNGNGGNNRSSHQNSGQPKRRAMPAPKLSWWQKLLRAIGFGKEAARPPRPERRPNSTEAKQTREPRRSKTRDARSDQSASTEAPAEKKRRDQGERNHGRPRGGDPASVENRRVYVGNLSYETTESDLEELFKGVGAVRRVEIVYNRSTHRSKGYGFIEMLDIDEAKRTVEVLHDQFFMGRKLTVSGAKSKDHEDAEQEEGTTASNDAAIPALAPIHPVKEEVIELCSEPTAEKAEDSQEQVAEIATAEDNSNPEVPTEEFTPEENKEQATA